MNKQEIFDKVYKHLLTQGRRSRLYDVEGGLCAYRSFDGLKCAVGCLIEDANYSASMEESSVHAWAVKEVLIKQGVLPTNPTEAESITTLLSKLQQIHDVRNPSNWKHFLVALAEEQKLSVPELNNEQHS